MNYSELLETISDKNVKLIAVSKTKPEADILELYNLGQRDFGENRVQELVKKYESLPKDIRWHMIGHLQKNKVKYISEFIHLIHSADNLKLIQSINKEAAKCERIIDILLQIKIATEDSKFGFNWNELLASLSEIQKLVHVRVIGVMGMGTFTEDEKTTHKEFSQLKSYFDYLKEHFYTDSDIFKEISMGMSGDYKIAIEHGTTMVRIGSLLFGSR